MYDRLSIQCNLVNSNLYTVVTKCLCWKSPFMVYFYCVVSIPLWMWVKHQQIQSWILYTLSITTVNVGETPADSILNIIYTCMYHCECGWNTSRLNLEYYIHFHVPLWMWVKHQQIQSWILYTLSCTTVNVGEAPAD